jgi:predicted RNA-binding protein with PUA-like domain
MSERKIWIFQAVPTRYDLLGALADKSLTEDVWMVKQYVNEIRSGHIGLLWMAGKKAGIYALVDVISDPQMLRESEQSAKYWLDDFDRGQLRLRVKILRKSVLTNPILKDELKHIPELKNMEIFRQPQGTNKRVTNEEWNHILPLLKKRDANFKE